jgi:hypothetical protein
MSARPFPIADEVRRQMQGAFDDGQRLGEQIGYLQRQRDAYIVGACWGATLTGLAVWALRAAGYL